MTILRLVLGSILALLGGGVVTLNMRTMVCDLRGQRPPSPVPILAGILAAIGLAILPVRHAFLLAPIPIVLDYGGFLGMLSGLIRRR